jgi:hypothetical protein
LGVGVAIKVSNFPHCGCRDSGGLSGRLRGRPVRGVVLRAVSGVAAFNVPLTRIDATYFTISTATTTGMGDIHPVSGAARLLVSAQMIASLYRVVIAITTAVNGSLLVMTAAPNEGRPEPI